MAERIIYYASTGKTGKVLHLLHNTGVDVNAMNANQETALFYAAKFGRLSTVKSLLKHGADPNCMNLDGLTPVVIAAFQNHDSCLQALLGAGGTWFTMDDKMLKTTADRYNNKNDEYDDDGNEPSLHVPAGEIIVANNAIPFEVDGMFKISACRTYGTKMVAKIRKKSNTSDEDNNNDSTININISSYDLENLRSIRHPNVLQPFFTSQLENTKASIVLTEDVEYGNLYQVIHHSQTKMTSSMRNKILLQIIQACLFLHEKNTLHNFINPSSVYLGRDWNVRLGNLEYSANQFRNILPMDRHFHFKYMAPETIVSNVISTFSDVYSFGCLTWELFSQTQPWSWIGDSDITMLAYDNDNLVSLPMQTCWPLCVKKIVNESTRRDIVKRPSFVEIFEFSHQQLYNSSVSSSSSSASNQQLSSNECNLNDYKYPVSPGVDGDSSASGGEESATVDGAPSYLYVSVPSRTFKPPSELTNEGETALILNSPSFRTGDSSYSGAEENSEKEDLYIKLEKLLLDLYRHEESEKSITSNVKFFLEKCNNQTTSDKLKVRSMGRSVNGKSEENILKHQLTVDEAHIAACDSKRKLWAKEVSVDPGF